MESPDEQRSNAVLSKIIKSQPSLVTRLYCHIRFRIIPLRFLQEISQYIPEDGCVLDIGCGFGLFTLYFAYVNPRTQFLGIDVSESRIHAARQSASKLGLTNVEFQHADAVGFQPDKKGKFDVVVTLDVMHHIPPAAGDEVIGKIHGEILADKGRFVMKDITTRPRLMVWFTYALDFLMNPRDSFYYRSVETWTETLKQIGFSGISRHYLWDILPYPHVLIIARKSEAW